MFAILTAMGDSRSRSRGTRVADPPPPVLHRPVHRVNSGGTHGSVGSTPGPSVRCNAKESAISEKKNRTEQCGTRPHPDGTVVFGRLERGTITRRPSFMVWPNIERRKNLNLRLDKSQTVREAVLMDMDNNKVRSRDCGLQPQWRRVTSHCHPSFPRRVSRDHESCGAAATTSTTMTT